MAFATALLLPGDWFVPPPEIAPRIPPSFHPAIFVRALLLVDAALALLWAAGAPGWPAGWDAGRPGAPPSASAGEPGRPVLWLALLTALAAALRLYGLDSQIWVDEAAVLVGYRAQSFLDVVLATPSVNNHLLYSLAMRLSMVLFGDPVWAARLPAALAGIATVPALYPLARRALSRRDSFVACGMLAVSWHHVFFSQNARGYTFLILGAVVSTWLFLRALEENRTVDWAAYGIATVFTTGSIIFGLFVPAGHFAVWLAIAIRRRRGGRPGLPFAGRAPLVWTAAALATLHLYVGALPYRLSHLAVTALPGEEGDAVYQLTQAERLEQLARGLLAGLGGAGAVALALLLVPLAAGVPALLRRSPRAVAALAAPLLLMAPAIGWMAWSPRFFLVGLPAALILATGAAAAGRWGRVAPVILLAAFTTLSAASLPRYYGTPKQASRDSLAWVAGRAAAGERVALVANTAYGGLWYAPRVAPALDVVRVEDLPDMAALDPPAGWVLTTFEPALRAERPGLFAAIRRDYAPVRRFPATVENGEITVWRARALDPPRPRP